MIYKILLFGFMLLWISGCSVKAPAIVEYKIDAGDLTPYTPAQSCKQKVLKVQRIFAPSSLLSQHIYYGVGKHQQNSYTQARWIDAPNKMLSASVFGSLEQGDLFYSVIAGASHAQADLILETNVQEFMQYFNADLQQSYVKVALQFVLIQTDNKKIIATKSLALQSPCKSDDAQGGVEALQETLEEILNQKRVWLAKVCR